MKAKLLVVLVSAFLLVAMGGYLQQRYASPAEATLVLTELSNSDYPEEPGTKSINYRRFNDRTLRIVRRDATHFDFFVQPTNDPPPSPPHARCARPKVLGCGTRWDKAGRMRDNPLWLLWFLRGAAACPPAAAAHRQVPLATPQACRLARRYAPDRRQRDRRTEARLAREPVSVGVGRTVWGSRLVEWPYAPESWHPAYPGRSRDQNF